MKSVVISRDLLRCDAVYWCYKFSVQRGEAQNKPSSQTKRYEWTISLLLCPIGGRPWKINIQDFTTVKKHLTRIWEVYGFGREPSNLRVLLIFLSYSK